MNGVEQSDSIAAKKKWSRLSRDGALRQLSGCREWLIWSNTKLFYRRHPKIGMRIELVIQPRGPGLLRADTKKIRPHHGIGFSRCRITGRIPFCKQSADVHYRFYLTAARKARGSSARLRRGTVWLRSLVHRFDVGVFPSNASCCGLRFNAALTRAPFHRFETRGRYRVGDQLGAWSYGGLGPNGLGLSLNVISWFAVPITAGWCLLSLWLARKQHALALAQRREIPEVAVTT